MNIKEFRTKRNWTQKETAKFLQLNVRTVQNWEQRGSSEIVKHLLEVIEYLENELYKTKRQLEDNQLTFKI